MLEREVARCPPRIRRYAARGFSQLQKCVVEERERVTSEGIPVLAGDRGNAVVNGDLQEGTFALGSRGVRGLL